MTDLQTAAQQALGILDSEFTTVDGEFCRWCDGRLNAKHNCALEQTITALKAALVEPEYPLGQASTDVGVPVFVVKKAEPVQEPVASAGLGPLPEPAQPAEPEGYMPGCLWPLPATPDYYTAEQMREYALRALAEPTTEESSAVEPVQEPLQFAAIHAAWSAGYVEGEKAAWSAQPEQEPVQEPDTDCHLQGICQRTGYSIAQPVQEPVAWMYTGIKSDGTEHGPHLVWKPVYMDAMSASKGVQATPLYAAPPQRPAEPGQEPVAVDQRVVPLVESALQAVAEKIGDQCAVWYGIGARDVEEVLREAARHGLVHGALEEPVQEAVAYVDQRIHGWPDCFVMEANPPHTTPLYTSPTQRKPLTREQAIALWADKSDGPTNGEIVSYCRAVERAHKIGGEE